MTQSLVKTQEPETQAPASLPGVLEPRQVPRPLPNAELREQVTRYAQWLTEQVGHYTPAKMRHEVNRYIERATKVVEIGTQQIQTFAPFRYKYSALKTLTRKQVVIFSGMGAALLIALILQSKVTLLVLLSLVSIAYMLHLCLDFALALGAIQRPAEEEIDEQVIHALRDATWPVYTILCPLYREAQVVPQFVKAMKALDYPTDKLQILFLTEEDDVETRDAILALHLPRHFQVVTVPDGSPRTKPRACNYGLIEAVGQYCVIYDAEDVPDPLQLKKAVLTFARHGPRLACVQAKLNFYNPNQNLLTRWFTAEYSLWFDLILPGLQRAGFMIPLGGTSNHFPTHMIRAIGGWDAFNVTEDCDLGLRLAWFRLDTVVLNSTTYEEANSRFKNWIRQRSRWIKGYMQTYLVHMREPWHYIRHRRIREFVSLQLIIGGKSAVLFINPVLWLLLLYSLILRFFPGSYNNYMIHFTQPILIMSSICLIFGNFFYVYVYLLACIRRKQYQLVKWTLLIPLYWIMASIAATMAFVQLITKPHYWEKTVHGLHLAHQQHDDEVTWQDAAAYLEQVNAATQQDNALRENILLYSKQHVQLNTMQFPSVQMAIEEMITLPLPAFSRMERLTHENPTTPRFSSHWLLATLFIASLASIGTSWFHFQQSLPWLSIPSMLCFVVASLCIFSMVHTLTNDVYAGFLGALLFISNPAILSIQTTNLPMMLFVLLLSLISYHFLLWLMHTKPEHLVLSATWTLFATVLNREGWAILLALSLLIVVTGLLKRQRWVQSESYLLVFLLLAGLHVLFWNFTLPSVLALATTPLLLYSTQCIIAIVLIAALSNRWSLHTSSAWRWAMYVLELVSIVAQAVLLLTNNGLLMHI